MLCVLDDGLVPSVSSGRQSTRAAMKSSSPSTLLRAVCMALSGQHSRRLDELRIVHGDQRLQRRVRCARGARCSSRGSAR